VHDEADHRLVDLFFTLLGDQQPAN